MARYYFHTREGDQIDEDFEGIELPNLDAVEHEALLAAREMVAELVIRGDRIDGKCFEITDEAGKLVLAMPFKSTILRRLRRVNSAHEPG